MANRPNSSRALFGGADDFKYFSVAAVNSDNDDEEEWDGGDGDGNYDKQWVIIMLIIVLLTGGERAP